MKHWRVSAVATFAVAVAASLGIYAWQEIQQNQAQPDQIEQTPPRWPAVVDPDLHRSPAGGARRAISRRRSALPRHGAGPRTEARSERSRPCAATPRISTALTTRCCASVGGGRKLYDYRYAVNGFTAVLTPAQAAQLAQTPGVASVEPDAAAPLDTVTSPAFLGLDAPGGLWEQVGGVGQRR